MDKQTSIQIDKGVPIPAIGSRGGKPNLTALIRSLEVGDSFFITGKSLGLINSTAYQARISTPGLKITQRTITENGVEGIRVWRVA
jgi:hypothetical protein